MDNIREILKRSFVIENLYMKSIIMVMLVLWSVLGSLIIPYYIGLYVSEILSPTTMDYVCACNAPPILIKFQANITCGTYLICILGVMYYILRFWGLSKYSRWIWFIVLFILNGTSCFIAMNILSTEVSG